jgi:primosomal protein N' (replication factor Y) (superfamily II helicase)
VLKVARVALDVPLPRLFDYALPPGFQQHPEGLVGRRVAVPFGRGQQIGVVMAAGVEASVPLVRIKPLVRVFDAEPALAPDVLELLQFCSDYYRHPLGQVALGALPQRLRQVQRKDDEQDAFQLSAAGAAFDPRDLPARALVKRRVLAALASGAALDAGSVRGLAPAAGRALLELVRAGLVERTRMPAVTSAAEAQSAAPDDPPALTREQQHAASSVLTHIGSFAAFLLHGVTGSGKTEVYLQVVAEVLRRGLQALVLVPEINLTPQLVGRFQARFPRAPLVALHSNLADTERLRGWRAAQSGAAAVVVGTRLAVFTPLPRLGVIVVDEEHDASFKQQEGLRYSARDIALLRAKLRSVPALLGSATPSLETYANAISGRYRLLQLSNRPGTRLPSIRCIDTRRLPLAHGLSQPLLDAIRARIARGEQSLVFLNRRGYAPALICPACAWVCPCTRCSARLVLHLSARRLRCHYCGHEEPIAAVCPSCGNQDLRPAGHGTQRLEQALRQAFPGARVLRVDRDSTRGRNAFAAMQEQIRGQRVDVLVGTQMLAKGHDFPHLTLVGVVNADSALFSSDFRASERLYAQLTQVAGRAGRAALPGEVLIQTEFPGHPLYDAVCRQDYPAFARAALEERREAGFPPYTHQAVLRAEAGSRDDVDDYLARATMAAASLGFDVQVYDAVAPAVERVAGRERAQLLVQSESRAEMQRFLRAWHAELQTQAARKVRWALDVDPLEL